MMHCAVRALLGETETAMETSPNPRFQESRKTCVDWNPLHWNHRQSDTSSKEKAIQWNVLRRGGTSRDEMVMSSQYAMMHSALPDTLCMTGMHGTHKRLQTHKYRHTHIAEVNIERSESRKAFPLFGFCHLDTHLQIIHDDHQGCPVGLVEVKGPSGFPGFQIRVRWARFSVCRLPFETYG